MPVKSIIQVQLIQEQTCCSDARSEIIEAHFYFQSLLEPNPIHMDSEK